jgi:hypothetical protein
MPTRIGLSKVVSHVDYMWRPSVKNLARSGDLARTSGIVDCAGVLAEHGL